MDNTSASLDELQHVVAITSNKLRITASQPETDLRRLTLLCNALDQNTSLLQSILAASITYDSKEVAPGEDVLPEDEAYSSSDESEDSDVYEDVAFICGIDPMVGKDELWPHEADRS